MRHLLLILTLTGCPTEGSNQNDKGTWYQIRTPPGAADGIECWVWESGVGMGHAARGGPYCFVPE